MKREMEKFCNSSRTTCASEPLHLTHGVGTLTRRYACDLSREGEVMVQEDEDRAAYFLF